MNLRIPLAALIACIGISLTAHASDITYSLTSGAFSPSGSFSGTFLINPVSDLIDGGQFTATAPSGGTTFTFFNSANDSSVPGLALFQDASGDEFKLAINDNSGSLEVNTLALFGTSGDTSLITAAGARFDATGGSLSVSPAPEPSSLILLGTGALGFLGIFRRRLLNA